MATGIVLAREIHTKQPGEFRVYSFDFRRLLNFSLGERVASIAYLDYEGPDSLLNLGSTSIDANGYYASVGISSGGNGSRYRIECRVLTTLGNEIEADAYLDVTDGDVEITATASGAGEAEATGGYDQSTVYGVPASVNVLDAVYISGLNTVDKADSGVSGKWPAIGFVSSKPTSTTAIVQTTGELGGFSGLTPGLYYLGSAGLITATAPVTSGSAVQPMGTARSSSVFQIDPELAIQL